MFNLISFGDLVDVYYKVREKNSEYLAARFKNKLSNSRKDWDSVLKERNENWWEIPAVQNRMNELKTGEAELNKYDYIHTKYIQGKNGLHVLSPGCGTGGKELELARFTEISLLEAFDISEERIKIAQHDAETQNLPNLKFFLSDVYSFDFGEDKYDIIIFDSFLHHVDGVKSLLTKVKKGLKQDGILIIDEYVGPDRFQWTSKQLRAANAALLSIPTKFRTRVTGSVKNKIYRPGTLRMKLSDPSEAADSSSIRNSLNELFTPIVEKDYGGNLLQLVLKDIAHNFINQPEEGEKILRELFKLEDEFLFNEPSDFLFGIYKK